MKNIYRTILVWLLTAVIGSIIFGFMLNMNEAEHTGRFSLNTREVAFVSLIAMVVSLGLSLPATIIYHFLAVRLYERWENITKIKTVLGLYTVGATFLSVLILGLASAESMDSDFLLLVVPYAMAALISSLLFNYRPALQEQKWGDDSAVFSDEEEARFPKEIYTIVICITTLMALWTAFLMFNGSIYGRLFNTGISLIMLSLFVAGIILFANKDVKGWYLLFGYLGYGTISSLLGIISIMARYLGRIGTSYLLRSASILLVFELAPLILICTPQMTRWFQVKKKIAAPIAIAAALLVVVFWARTLL